MRSASRRSRALITAVVTAMLAIGAMAAPAAAANPRLTIVNGIPGRTVDICIGNSEVRSGLKYGSFVVRFVNPGTRTIRFRDAGPGTCKGSTLARRTFELAVDDDLTIVGTQLFPKVVDFDNTPHPVTTIARARFRHAADLGAVNVIQLLYGFSTPAPAAAPPPFIKGQQTTPFDYVQPYSAQYILYRAGAGAPFRQTPLLSVQTGQQLEAILVGSTLRNDKVVVIRRTTPAP